CQSLSFTGTPPRATRFPYTTLFRSRAVRPAVRLVHQLLRGMDESPEAAKDHAGAGQSRRTANDRGSGGRAVLGHDGSCEIQEPQDRKSTRLNSSHEWISYAVFCLKK